METQMTDLRALAERVERGETLRADALVLAGDGGDLWWRMFDGINGSLDAALAFLRAVLPGRLWEIRAGYEGEFSATVEHPGPDKQRDEHGGADSPARALVAATLRALAAEKKRGE